MVRGRDIDTEWPTVALLAGCYIVWLLAGWLHAEIGLLGYLVATVPCVTLHSSLQHEALHGHPTRNARVNEALVSLPLGLAYPYRRFKTLHLRHHNDAALTDPYDDPESFFLAMADWRRLPAWLRAILSVNNTFAGRLLIGPAVMLVGFCGSELRQILRGDREVARAWLHHAAGLAVVVAWLAVAGVPLWLHAAAAYLGLSLLGIRTFAEHQASEVPEGRTIIVEAAPVFALLFLNNNLHFVHHQHPRVPWYRLPELYRARRDAFRAANRNYCYDGYGALLRRYLWRPKQPVPHPFLRRD